MSSGDRASIGAFACGTAGGELGRAVGASTLGVSSAGVASGLVGSGNVEGGVLDVEEAAVVDMDSVDVDSSVALSDWLPQPLSSNPAVARQIARCFAFIVYECDTP